MSITVLPGERAPVAANRRLGPESLALGCPLLLGAVLTPLHGGTGKLLWVTAGCTAASQSREKAESKERQLGTCAWTLHSLCERGCWSGEAFCLLPAFPTLNPS